MYKIYDMWPKLARDAYESNLESIHFGNINHIVFAGMGGSGALGDFISAILSKTNIHVDVVKGYLLPKTANENTLVVTTSISGNTVETLTVLDSAIKENCHILAFSSGGKMESFCIENKIHYKKIAMTHSPRSSFPTYLYSILKILGSTLSIQKNDIYDSIHELENLSKKISSNNLTETNTSLDLSEWINSIPLIYYPWGLQSTAIRFKNSLQENSKIHVIIEDVIESSHNGIVAWEHDRSIQPILLQGTDDYFKTKERWSIIKEYFHENNIKYKEITSVKGNIISKLISMIYLLDYASLYLAVKNKIDPSTVKSIEFIKYRL